MKNPSQGDLLRDAGIAEVLSVEPDDWQTAYMMHWQIYAIANSGKEVTGEDFRQYVEPIIGSPHHQNVWGAMWRSVCTSPWLVNTGKTRKMRVPSSHSRVNPVWRIR